MKSKEGSIESGNTSSPNPELREITDINATYDAFCSGEQRTAAKLYEMITRINNFMHQFCDSDNLILVLQTFLQNGQQNVADYRAKHRELVKCQKIATTYFNWCCQTQQNEAILASATKLQSQLLDYTTALDRVIEFVAQHNDAVNNQAQVLQFMSSLLLILQAERDMNDAVHNQDYNALLAYREMFQNCFINGEAFSNFLLSDVPGNDLFLYYDKIIEPLRALEDQINALCDNYEAEPGSSPEPKRVKA